MRVSFSATPSMALRVVHATISSANDMLIHNGPAGLAGHAICAAVDAMLRYCGRGGRVAITFVAGWSIVFRFTRTCSGLGRILLEKIRMTSRILALNLPANAAQEVAGNPIVSRWESVVANCFPGLEIDHRNLDRRFFPGLIFDFISDLSNNPKSSSVGARLVGVDIEDFKNSHPADKVLKQLIPRLLEFQKALANGSRLFLHSLQQGSSPPIKLGRQKQTDRPLDGLVVWRLVRSLTPGMVTLILVERGQAGRERVYEKITARRRTYQNKQGALLTAYKPGELNQSLCSPWQHDFRDCSCNYWASNHPDIVLGAHPANLSELLKDPKEADQADRRFIWLRWDQSGEVPPLPTRTACRPF